MLLHQTTLAQEYMNTRAQRQGPSVCLYPAPPPTIYDDTLAASAMTGRPPAPPLSPAPQKWLPRARHLRLRAAPGRESARLLHVPACLAGRLRAHNIRRLLKKHTAPSSSDPWTPRPPRPSPSILISLLPSSVGVISRNSRTRITKISRTSLPLRREGDSEGDIELLLKYCLEHL